MVVDFLDIIWSLQCVIELYVRKVVSVGVKSFILIYSFNKLNLNSLSYQSIYYVKYLRF